MISKTDMRISRRTALMKFQGNVLVIDADYDAFVFFYTTVVKEKKTEDFSV